MKKKRLVIAAFLLVACAFLGIGYAAITDDLSITGTVKTGVDNENFIVVFDDSSANEPVIETVCGAGSPIADHTVTVDGLGTVSASIVIDSFKAKGDKAVITLTVANKSKVEDLTANLTEITVSNLNSEYTVTAVWASGNATETLAVGSTTKIIVTVVSNKTFTTNTTATNFTVSFKAQTN